MANIGILKLDPISIERSCNGNQICFLSKEQVGMVGSVFSLRLWGDLHHFKIIDIWFAPTDFAKKFLWRMCGLNDINELNVILTQLQLKNDVVFAHIYSPVAWNDIQNMVKQ
jgi:hypothetical protein